MYFRQDLQSHHDLRMNFDRVNWKPETVTGVHVVVIITTSNINIIVVLTANMKNNNICISNENGKYSGTKFKVTKMKLRAEKQGLESAARRQKGASVNVISLEDINSINSDMNLGDPSNGSSSSAISSSSTSASSDGTVSANDSSTDADVNDSSTDASNAISGTVPTHDLDHLDVTDDHQQVRMDDFTRCRKRHVDEWTEFTRDSEARIDDAYYKYDASSDSNSGASDFTDKTKLEVRRISKLKRATRPNHNGKLEVRRISKLKLTPSDFTDKTNWQLPTGGQAD